MNGPPLPPLAFRLALRDFRGGLGGFLILLACLALGLMAIVGVGSVSRSLGEGLIAKGRVILGGDMSFELVQREARADEIGVLSSYGRVSRVALMRAMARRADGQAALVEIKAVDAAYPAEGAVALTPPQNLAAALALRDGVYGVAADAALNARLALKPNEVFTIGAQKFALRAILASEPDKLAGGIGFGPRVLMSETALRATNLLQPGALDRWAYRLTLRGGETPEAVATAVRKALPAAGFEIRTWKDVSPEFSRDLKRFSQFLILVGLSALLIGGVGVANAVAGFVERKTATIATLKAVGASGGFVFAIMLIEVMAMAFLGMVAGIALGAALPFALDAVFGAALPFPFVPSIFPQEIAAGLLYGTLTTLTFSLLPLGRAHEVPVSALFRDEIAPEPVRPKRRYAGMFAAAAASFALAVVLLAPDRKLALVFLVAALGGFAALRGAAALLMFAARTFGRVRNVELRFAVANLHRPGALTPAIVLSLGLGLTLIVALALIDGNLHSIFSRSQRGATPDFFFVGVGRNEARDFRNFVLARAPGAKFELVPMLRGRIVSLNGRPAETAKPSSDAAWALQGDRGITFADSVPVGSRLVAGSWWAKDYAGPPLVSMAADVAEGLGLRIGDRIAVNVLGREIDARIANLRKVDWANLGINFVLVFTPDTFAAAPYSDLVTLTFAPRGTANETALVRDTAKTYPNVVSLRVKDALNAVKEVVDELAAAVRGAAVVALLAATLVLAGALAAAQRARLYDVVVLKVLGATRRRLIAALICEFGLIGAATALFGVIAGGAAAVAVVRLVMKLEFIWLWPQALGAAAAAFAASVLLGLLGTWRVLGRKPAQFLRNL